MLTFVRNASVKLLPRAPMPFRSAAYSLLTSDGEGGEGEAEWTVEIVPGKEMIRRQIWARGQSWKHYAPGWEPEEVIWPAWPAQSEDEVGSSASPLAGAQDYWSTAGNRLRDSAKWMAAVLGAGLVTVAGTSPLSGMREHPPQAIAIALGVVGLLFLGITLFLVLQVMRPQSLSFSEVQAAEPRKRRWLPLPPPYKWRQNVEEQQDLYLPRGVRSLTNLRQSMIIGEITVEALARARATARDRDASRMLCDAEAARATRLQDLRTAASRIVTIGGFYKLHSRSTWATFCGVPLGLLGTAAIVAAFAWPLK